MDNVEEKTRSEDNQRGEDKYIIYHASPPDLSVKLMNITINMIITFSKLSTKLRG